MTDQGGHRQDDLRRTDAPHDDLAAYAFGVLDAEEQAEFEAHLAGCNACQADLPAQRRVGGLLPRGLSRQTPPDGAWTRLLARARAEINGPPAPPAQADPLPAPEPVTAPSSERTARPVDIDVPPPRAALEPIPSTRLPQRPRQRKIRLASLGWAAALLVVLSSGLFVGAWSATGPHASPTVEMQARLPGGQVLPLAGTGVPAAKARLFVVGNGRQAELAVDRLPPLPVGRIYQLWFAEPGQPTKTGGTFTVDSSGGAVARVTIPTALERVRAVAVTEEPAPGSPGPTGPHLLDWTP